MGPPGSFHKGNSPLGNKSGFSLNEQAKKLTKDNDRNRRLGIKLKNPKRSWIRIAPVKDSNIKPGLLSEKVREVDKWIHDTLGKIRSKALPKKFSAIS